MFLFQLIRQCKTATRQHTQPDLVKTDSIAKLFGQLFACQSVRDVQRHDQTIITHSKCSCLNSSLLMLSGASCPLSGCYVDRKKPEGCRETALRARLKGHGQGEQNARLGNVSSALCCGGIFPVTFRTGAGFKPAFRVLVAHTAKSLPEEHR